MNPNFESYKVFYQVAACGNITLAAQALFLSQPTVSRCIQNLETELGCSLFVRSKKGVTLTQEGAMLYQHVAKACQHIFAAEAELKNRRELAAGTIRLGASEMTLRHYLRPCLRQFHEAYPALKFQIQSCSTPKALAALREGSLDLAVIISPVEEDEAMAVKRLSIFQDIAVAGPAFRSLKGQPLSLSDLTAYPLISLEPETATRQFLNRQFQAQGLTLQPDIELPTADLLCPMAEENLGIAFVPENFAREALKQGRLFALDLLSPIPPRHICAVRSRLHPPSLAGQAFLEVCMEGRNGETG